MRGIYIYIYMFTGRVDDIAFDDEEYMKMAGHHWNHVR